MSGIPEYTERVSEDPWVRRPERVSLLWQSEDQHEQIGDGQVEETVVGRRVHVMVTSNHEARRDVANETRDEDQDIDDSQWNDHREALASRTKQ